MIGQLTTRQRRVVYNSTYPKGGVSCSVGSLVVVKSFVLHINISGKNPLHRKSANL